MIGYFSRYSQSDFRNLLHVIQTDSWLTDSCGYSIMDNLLVLSNIWSIRRILNFNTIMYQCINRCCTFINVHTCSVLPVSCGNCMYCLLSTLYCVLWESSWFYLSADSCYLKYGFCLCTSKQNCYYYWQHFYGKLHRW